MTSIILIMMVVEFLPHIVVDYF